MADDHRADGTDPAGRDLTLTIRIAADGSLYFHDLTADLLPVAAAMCPNNPTLAARLAAAQQMQEHRE